MVVLIIQNPRVVNEQKTGDERHSRSDRGLSSSQERPTSHTDAHGLARILSKQRMDIPIPTIQQSGNPLSSIPKEHTGHYAVVLPTSNVGTRILVQIDVLQVVLCYRS